MSAQAARVYLRGMLKQAGIEKKISPHKLRHTYARSSIGDPRWPIVVVGILIMCAEY